MVGSTLTTFSSNRQTSVQIYTFGSEFESLKKSVEESVMLRYHLQYMGVNNNKSSPIFVENMSVVLNTNNHGS